MKYPREYPAPVHIKARAGSIAHKVILCGDPLRAKWIADTFLTGVTLVSSVRNMYFFTGKFKGVAITVGGHGMGAPSLAIYAHELFDFYHVQIIIRIGTCGWIGDHLFELNSFVNVKATCASSSDFSARLLGKKQDLIAMSVATQKKITEQFHILLTSNEISDAVKTKKMHAVNVYSDDLFYRERLDDLSPLKRKYHVQAVEMECYALSVLAQQFKREVGALLIGVSQQNPITKKWKHTTPDYDSLRLATLTCLNVFGKK